MTSSMSSSGMVAASRRIKMLPGFSGYSNDPWRWSPPRMLSMEPRADRSLSDSVPASSSSYKKILGGGCQMDIFRNEGKIKKKDTTRVR